MTRRRFITALCVTTTVPCVRAEETRVPKLGTILPNSGFIVSGVLSNAGQEEPRYYAIQNVALMLDPEKHPTMIQGADALLGQDVELVLRAK